MKQIKISIIGFDNLMESLFAYISKPLLNNDTQLSFNATVGNQKEYDEKISKYDFPIFLKNNYQALIKLKPDILFFAPPPSEATSILKDEIKKYFEYAKKNNLIIPDIYAFPPVPFVEEYQHILGNNIFSVNILPNDIRNIDKKLIQEKGINFCTFSPIYPPEKRIRLEKFISSFGKIVEFSSIQILPILSTRVLSTAFSYIYILIFQFFEQKNLIISIKDLSLIFQNSKKKKLRLNFDYRAKLSMIVRTWKKGLINYAISQGFSHALSSNLVNSMIELVHKNAEIHQIQELKELILISATKGGLLKTAIDHINMKIHPLVNIILDKFNCQNLKKNYLLLENMVKETCNAVLTHATLELQK